jgi:hypothetical protein
VIGDSSAASVRLDTRRQLPARSWIGLAVMAISEALMLAQIEPFYSWHTPIAWTGFILFADGLVWKRRARSWMNDAPAEFVFLAIVSVPLWIIFELYNKYTLHNWYYLGLPESLLIRYIGYAWSFATISPAIFETGDLISSLRVGRHVVYDAAPRPFTRGQWICMVAGAAMLLLPIVYPSTYLAAPVWLGFIILVDPINARAGDESILGDLRNGEHGRFVNLLLSGLVCGLIWECWNYEAGTKWKYNVPILPELKIFEMPILGFAGFPPFAVECFVLYVFVRRRLWRGATYAISV